MPYMQYVDDYVQPSLLIKDVDNVVRFKGVKRNIRLLFY